MLPIAPLATALEHHLGHLRAEGPLSLADAARRRARRAALELAISPRPHLPLRIRPLLLAYRAGFFPTEYEGRLALRDPRERAVMPVADLRVPRSVRRARRDSDIELRMDRRFGEVVRRCADRPGTWLGPRLIDAYGRLHRLGAMHSAEGWREDRLVSGMVLVRIGRFAGGETFFHREPDAGNLLLVLLAEHLRERGVTLWDVQESSPHLERFGAHVISRDEFAQRLREALSGTARARRP